MPTFSCIYTQEFDHTLKCSVRRHSVIMFYIRWMTLGRPVREFWTLKTVRTTTWNSFETRFVSVSLRCADSGTRCRRKGHTRRMYHRNVRPTCMTVCGRQPSPKTSDLSGDGSSQQYAEAELHRQCRRTNQTPLKNVSQRRKNCTRS